MASSSDISKFRELLEYMTIATQSQLKRICEKLHRDLVILLTNIAYQLLYSKNIALSDEHRVLLKKHKKHIKALSNKRFSLKNKRALLKNKGHLFLAPMLDHLVAPYTTS